MSDLNPEQLQAVLHIEGPLLVLAGAGSGKTRVVTHRISHLVDIGVLPSDILAVTFTNKAAEELRLRIQREKKVQVLACTFHSLGARILRESIHTLGYSNDFIIYDEEDSEKHLKNCLDERNLSKSQSLFKELRMQISNAKNNCLEPEAIENNGELKEIYSLYQARLKENNALDFDDLLFLPLVLFRTNEQCRKEYQNRWLFVLIDEYQDTNFSQHKLAQILVEKHQNIFAVGDPDQSIYSWRGARYENILNFQNDFKNGKVVTLNQNYRSTNFILEAANHLISHNTARYKKKLWSNLGDGEKIGFFIGQNERQEAEFAVKQLMTLQQARHFENANIAILYRTNAQSRAFEDALLSRKIPYVVIGGLSFYQRREIKDILAYLRMLTSSSDFISFSRSINLPKRGIGATTLEKIAQHAAIERVPIFCFCERIVDDSDHYKHLHLSEKQKANLAEYIQIIRALREMRNEKKLDDLISETILKINYLKYLQEDPETEEDRKQNVIALISKASEWTEEHDQPTLNAFLEELTLHSAKSELRETSSINLMTIHNSKGLEFDLVFIGGMEEELFPHINIVNDSRGLEEERRLCYVGMTRAKQLLYLTAARYRFMWGQPRLMQPSRFLQEIPTRYIKNHTLLLNEKPIEKTSFSEKDLAVGQNVYHREFGNGTIRKAYHTSFGITYEVYFDSDNTTRNLVGRYARLQPRESDETSE